MLEYTASVVGMSFNSLEVMDGREMGHWFPNDDSDLGCGMGAGLALLPLLFGRTGVVGSGLRPLWPLQALVCMT